jgi:hypothetical protein
VQAGEFQAEALGPAHADVEALHGVAGPALPQPFCAARMNPYTSNDVPAVDVSAPARSNRPGSRSDSATNLGASTAMNPPTGTFTNSTHRHDAHIVSIPPRTSPTTIPALAAIENTASARARRGPSSNVSASDAGPANAAPAPCAARAASSHAGDVANPPASDASVNTAAPATNTRRCPKMSPARPPSSNNPPNASVYAFTTHDRFSEEKPRLDRMLGSATFTIEASTTRIS